MELKLNRVYYSEGTNGALYWNGIFICHTIECPNLNNLPKRSCIPAGRYPLRKRYSLRFGWHIWIGPVPGRSLILFHPANDAQKELGGCIAPVSVLCGAGKGRNSGDAFLKLRDLVYKALEKGERVFLIISP